MNIMEQMKNCVNDVDVLLKLEETCKLVVAGLENKLGIKFTDGISITYKEIQVYKGIDVLAFMLGADTETEGKYKRFKYMDWTWFQLADGEADGEYYWK